MNGSLVIGFLIIFSELALWLLENHLAAGLVIAGIVFLIAQAINLRKPEFDRILDERVERISEKAGFYAFWVLVSSLAVITSLSWYFELRLRDVLECEFLAGILSFAVLRFYFSRRELE